MFLINICNTCFINFQKKIIMPQLDSTTFFSQIFFTFILFIIFYINIIKNVIPLINSFLQSRNKNFTLNQINTNNTQLITNFISNIKKYKFNNIFSNYIIKTKNVLI